MQPPNTWRSSDDQLYSDLLRGRAIIRMILASFEERAVTVPHMTDF